MKRLWVILACLGLECALSATVFGGEDKANEALDEALREAQSTASDASGRQIVEPIPATGDIFSRRFGERANVRLMDIGLIGVFAAGGSTEPDESLETLQGGAHDPTQRGFNVQQAELVIAGAIDPYFRADANIVLDINNDGDTIVELEELYVTTLALPFGLQIKGGQYLTEFGLMNPSHPHGWDWMDQPVIVTRLFGGDGQRAPGARIGWLMPLPFYTQLQVGAQNARGETVPSFLGAGETVGGRPFIDRPFDGLEELLYSARLESSGNLGANFTTKFGVSGLFGPNSTGENGGTYVWGVDFLAKYLPKHHFRGYPFVKFQGEFMQRIYEADTFFDAQNIATTADDIFLDKDLLHDYGFYAQVLYGFLYGWEAGVRYEYATGDGPSIVGRNNDPFRDDRHRVSPLIAWRPTEFSRLRLQANYDNADHLPRDDALSVWFGFDFLIGSHPAHKF